MSSPNSIRAFARAFHWLHVAKDGMAAARRELFDLPDGNWCIARLESLHHELWDVLDYFEDVIPRCPDCQTIPAADGRCMGCRRPFPSD